MTECCICLEQFQLDGDKTPKLLPFSHTLCLQCLQELSNGQRNIRCPECRHHHEAPERNVINFPTNRYILEILEYKKNIADLQHKVQSADEVIQSMMHEAEVAQNKVCKNGGTRTNFGEPSILRIGSFVL